jgi:hypothetical protein
MKGPKSKKVRLKPGVFKKKKLENFSENTLICNNQGQITMITHF